MNGFVSRATVTAVGLACKAFLNIGYCSLTVSGLHHLSDALKSPTRTDGQGLITDDPVAWGVLPARHYLSSRTTRWTLGASDVMFTNPHGQIIETFRGKGIYQPAVDTAIQKLDQGGWVHLFGEGKVNQPRDYPQDVSGIASLPRFKWGVRILMETMKPPVIIPMWLTGFDKLMPEGRVAPWKFLPRYGAQLSVTFGNPVSPSEILDAIRAVDSKMSPPDSVQPTGWVRDQLLLKLQAIPMAQEDHVRSAVTAVIQQRVEALGRTICGDTLTR
ncbi:hypothetical protein C0993_003218 [Termitomyces sp. T159_Od127]|nr:hypothetical protein C0993_003218 [Termitomyces sp. T159_Od127]